MSVGSSGVVCVKGERVAKMEKELAIINCE